MSKVRCAIYTRKSSEEGLEQDFNSLHAQREACAAYILSQASEGWTLLPGDYVDGGMSGGTLERPALQRLLDDIAAGKLDIVVVYKVDRLTRSLLDVARLVEAMDKAGVSFVSVTQSFNTTTSMGRLTLNMLLSFAQFEREVTAERIRDKIAASKAEGMWMGGTPPLGYAPNGRSLKIVEEHAPFIRDIFARYLTLGNVRLLQEQLVDEGIMVPSRTTGSGKVMGGIPFSRGQLYKILGNPIYAGDIPHRGQTYQGQHPAIIDRATWTAVQAQLAANSQGEQRAATVKSSSLFAGRVTDAEGHPLHASHACKGEVRHRYYVGIRDPDDAAAPRATRIPAMELEKVVCEHLAREVRRPLALLSAASLEIPTSSTGQLAECAKNLAEQIEKRGRFIVRQLIDKIVVEASALRVELRVMTLSELLGLPSNPELAETKTFAFFIPATLKRAGLGLRLIEGDGRLAGECAPQEHLLKLIHRAGAWWQHMQTETLSIGELAHQHSVTSSYASRLIRLNFLAPTIVAAIAEGRQPAHLDAKKLLTWTNMPGGWDKQAEKPAMT